MPLIEATTVLDMMLVASAAPIDTAADRVPAATATAAAPVWASMVELSVADSAMLPTT